MDSLPKLNLTNLSLTLPLREKQKGEEETKSMKISKLFTVFKKQLKPLSELPNSEEDCRKIYKIITGREMTRIKLSNDTVILLEGEPNNIVLHIKYDGSTHGLEGWKASTIFTVVDFIRSLGYEPNQKTNKATYLR